MKSTASRLRRSFGSFAAGSLCLVFIGCGAPTQSKVELGTVTGVVTLDGKPLSDVMVSFNPRQANGTPDNNKKGSTGTTDANGKFELEYSTDRMGALVGMHSITFPGSESKLPPAYSSGDPKVGVELVAEVKPGAQNIEIKLEQNPKPELNKRVN